MTGEIHMTRKAYIGVIFLVCCALMLQFGCGKPKPSRFYILSPLPPEEAPSSRQDVSTGIGPVEFPDYLLRPQIVTQTNANQLDYAEYERWAEPLNENFARVLADNLTHLIPTDRVHLYPWLGTLEVHYRLLIEVIRFDQGEDGQITLTALWGLLDAPNREQLLQRRSSFSRPAADTTGYAGIAAAMSELVGEFSREVAQALQSIRRQ